MHPDHSEEWGEDISKQPFDRRAPPATGDWLQLLSSRPHLAACSLQHNQHILCHHLKQGWKSPLAGFSVHLNSNPRIDKKTFLANFSNSDLCCHLNQVQLLVQVVRDRRNPCDGRSHMDEDLLSLFSRATGELDKKRQLFQ